MFSSLGCVDLRFTFFGSPLRVFSQISLSISIFNIAILSLLKLDCPPGVFNLAVLFCPRPQNVSVVVDATTTSSSQASISSSNLEASGNLRLGIWFRVGDASSSKRSLGQKRRREREAAENFKAPESRSRRSIAQRARRQRELADKIEAALTSTVVATDQQESRSQAQKFRRRIEAAQRRLQAHPDCGSVGTIDATESLDILLEYNEDHFSRCRNESLVEGKSTKIQIQARWGPDGSLYARPFVR
ncbi:hypothetical protein R3P38DRAFT_2772174 [Favolaschia claudopus]|uniref:Uncharacterized protein n=1 Tax=Favolaschia claudopus TaxID=2862362 RepID=A0AAW0C7H2_9AGAR